MKILTRIPYLLIVIMALVVFGCKKDKVVVDDPEADTIDKLSISSWNCTAASLDGEDRTADFSNFVLTITSSKQYSTSGVDPLYSAVWPTSGSWDFKDTGGAIPDLTTVIRDGSLEVSITVLTETNLELRFEYITGSIEGTTSTEGQYIFTFSH